MARNKTVSDCLELIRKLNENGLSNILIGGQAVNFWATFFAQHVAEIDARRPFTSEDVDAIPEVAGDIHSIHLPSGLAITHTSSPVDGQLAFVEAGDLRMDLLSDPYGLHNERSKVVQRAREVELDDFTFKVIDPVLLLKSKLISLMGLDQKGRQDRKHAEIMLLVLREYLGNFLPDLEAGNITGRDLIRETKLAIAIEKNALARQALQSLNQDISQNLPCARFEAVSDETFARFWDNQQGSHDKGG